MLERYVRQEPLAVAEGDINAAPKKRFNIGEGAYGVVYKGIDTWTGSEVALKTFNRVEPGDGFQASTLREITILNRLNHDNVVRLLDVLIQQGDNQVEHDARITLVMELADTDLKHFMDEHNGPLSADLVKTLTFQILKGVAHCHSVGVMHRDLKPQNILVRHNGSPGSYTIKIADFGLSRTFGFVSRPLTTMVVTLWYRAPELLLGNEFYDKAVDIWSIACVMIEMANYEKMAAFQGHNTFDQLIRIFLILGTPQVHLPAFPENFWPEIFWPEATDFPDWSPSFPQWYPRSWSFIAPRLPAEGHSLLCAMLTYSHKKRITASAAMMHPYFESLDHQTPAIVTPESGSPGTPVGQQFVSASLPGNHGNIASELAATASASASEQRQPNTQSYRQTSSKRKSTDLTTNESTASDSKIARR